MCMRRDEIKQYCVIRNLGGDGMDCAVRMTIAIGAPGQRFAEGCNQKLPAKQRFNDPMKNYLPGIRVFRSAPSRSAYAYKKVITG